MQFNVDTELKDFTGKPIYDGTTEEDEEGKPKPKALSLKSVCVNALTAFDKDISGDEHCRRYRLAQQIYDAEETVDVVAEDMSLIKKRIPAAFQAPIVVGQALEMLDPPAETKK